MFKVSTEQKAFICASGACLCVTRLCNYSAIMMTVISMSGDLVRRRRENMRWQLGKLVRDQGVSSHWPRPPPQ